MYFKCSFLVLIEQNGVLILLVLIFLLLNNDQKLTNIKEVSIISLEIKN